MLSPVRRSNGTFLVDINNYTVNPTGSHVTFYHHYWECTVHANQSLATVLLEKELYALQLATHPRCRHLNFYSQFPK